MNSKKDTIPIEVTRRTTAFMKAASALYPSEPKRSEVLSPLLSDILGVHVQMVTNSDRTCPDGIVEFRVKIWGRFMTLLIEYKNESGDGSSDASTQAGLGHARTWGQPKVSFLLVV
jgi:hypothetical protein